MFLPPALASAVPESGRLLRFGFANFRNFAIFGNVGNLVNIGPFTLMGARVLSLRRAALAGHPFYHLVDRLVHQCFFSRVTAREDDRASSLKKRVRYSSMLLWTSS